MRNAADAARRFNVKRSGGGRAVRLGAMAALLAGTALAPAQAAPTDLLGAPLAINNAGLTVDGFTNSVGTATLTYSDAGDVGIVAADYFTDSGAGVLALTRAGTGELTLLVGNNYSGGTLIQQGIVVLGANGSAGTGAITIGNGATLGIGNGLFLGTRNLALANALTIGGAGTTATIDNGAASTLNNNGTVTVAGSSVVINGATTGAGTLRLSGGQTTLNNTAGFTGNLALSGALYELRGATSLGSGALVVETGSGSILRNDSGSTLSYANAINGAGALLGITGADNLGLSGVITLSELTKAGAGVLTLSNSANQMNLTMLGGTVVANANGAIGAGTVTVGANSTLRAGAAGLAFGNDVFLQPAAILTVDTQANTLTLSGSKIGGGGLVKTGSGILNLGGANSYTGGTAINAGTINLTGTLGGAVNVNTGTLSGTGTAGGTVTVTSNGRLSPGTNSTTGTLTAGTLNLLTGSTLTLNLTTPGGANDFITTTDASIGNGAVLAPSFAGSIGQGVYNFLSASNILGVVAGGFTVVGTPADFTYTVAYGLTTSLNVVYTGTYNWDGSNTTGGGGIAGGNGTWNLTTTNWTNSDGSINTNYGNLPTSDVSFAGESGTVNVAAAINFDSIVFGTTGYLLNGAGTLNLAPGAGLGGGSTITTGGGISAQINTAIAGGRLNKTGDGTLILGGTNTYSGGTIVDAGTLDVRSNAALGTGQVNIFGDTILLAGASGLTLTNVFNISTGGGGDLTVDTGTSTLTLSGNKGGTEGVTKIGTGTLVLGGTNNYLGDTDVNAGTLQLMGTITGAINVASGASLTGTGSGTGTTIFADGATVAPGLSPGLLTLGTTVFNNASNLNFELAGVSATPGVGADLIDVNGDLTLDGVLNITPLAGFNVGTGNRTLITYNNLLANGGVTISNVEPVDVDYTVTTSNGVGGGAGSVFLTVAFTGTYNWDGADNAPDGFIDGGNGTFNLSNTNFTNSDGTFNLAYGNATTDDISFGGESGTVDVASAINFDQMIFATSGYLLEGEGSLNVNAGPGGSTIDTGTGISAQIDTQIAGGRLVKTGDGTLILGAANTFNGGMEIGGGTVNVVTNTSLGLGSVDVTAASTLQSGNVGLSLANIFDISGGDLTVDTGSNTMTLSGAKTGTDGLTKIGTGTLVLGGANSYAGTTTVSVGTLDLAGTTTGDIDVLSGATLVGIGSADGTVTIADGATLAPGNSPGNITVGNLVLNNASILDYELAGLAAVPGVGADLTTVTSDLTLDGVLDITDIGGFNVGQGDRIIISYGNLLADNTLTINTAPPVDVVYSIVTTTVAGPATGAGDVLLNVDFTGIYRWDGADGVPNGIISGGNGTWNLTNTNWTNSDGTFNLAYENLPVDEVEFGGVASGTVNVADAITWNTMTFVRDGYVLNGAGTLNVADAPQGSAIDVGAGFTARIDTVITSAATPTGGVLSKEGDGRLVLTGTNTYTGGTDLNAGTLQIQDGDAIGSGLLRTQGGTTLVAGLVAGPSTITLANNVELASGLTTIDLLGTGMSINLVTGGVGTDGNTLVLDGVVSGPGSFTTSSYGMITLNGDNTFTGDVGLNKTVVNVGNNNALGLNNTVTIGFSSGIRNTAAGTTWTLANDIVTNDENAFIGGAGNLVLTGVVSGGPVNGLTKSGSGTVTLANVANTISGPIEVARGELSITGALTNAAQTTTVSGGAMLSGTGSIAGTVEVLNNGTLSAGVGGAGQVGALTINTLLLNTQSALVFDLGAAGIDGGPLNDQILTTDLRLGGQLTVRQSAGGSFGLGVYNLFKYDTLLAGSTDLDVVSLPGAFSGLVQTVVPGEVNLIVTAPGTLFQYWDGADLIGGDNVITGGPGTWNAANSNWTGDPSELNTTWFDNSVAIFRTIGGTVTVNGTFDPQGLVFEVDGYTLTGGKLNNDSTGVGTGMFVDVVTPATATINSEIQGNGILFKDGGGTLVLGFANTNFSGPTQVRVGALQLNDEQAAGTGVITLFDQTTLINGVSGQNVANNIVTLGEGTIDSGTGFFTLSGVISGNGSIIKDNNGTLILTGTNTYLGGTVLDGGFVQVSRDANLGEANGTVTFNNGSTLVFENGAVAFDSIRNITANSNANLITNGTADVTLNGVVSGVSGLLKLGTGTLVLTGTNTYQGGTGIFDGVLSVSRDANLGQAGTLITFGSSGNGVLRYTNGATPVTSNRGVLLVTDGTIETTGTASVDFTGVVTGGGKLNKTGSGTLGLFGNNNYSGGTDIEAGTVVVDNNNSLGTGNVRLFSDATLANLPGTAVNLTNSVETLGNGLINASDIYLFLSGPVSGAGSISQVGSGVLLLGGNNSFINLGINSGTVGLGSNTAAGNGSIAINDNATLGFFDNGLVIENDITTTGNGLVATGIPSLGIVVLTSTLNGDIGGPGSITKLLAGNLILNGDNSFVNLGITEGTVTLGTDTAAGVGNIAMFNNTTLAAGMSGLMIANDIQTLGNGLIDQGTGIFTLNGNIGGAGSLSAINSGNLVLNGDNSFVNLGINNGRVTVGSDTAAGIGSIAINTNTTLANNKTVTLANGVVTTGNGLVDVLGGTSMTLNGNVGGPGSISQIGAGNLVLNGNNSFTNLGINNGRVTVGSNTAAGIGNIAINSNATLANNKDVTLGNNVQTTGNGLVDVLGGTSLTLNGTVGGAGSISQIGAGNLVLNGNNGFVNLGINAGTVTVGSNTAAGVGNIAINNNATLANNKTVTLINNVQTTANGLVDVLGGTVLTLNGNVSGAGSISQVGAGNLVLNGDNSFTNLGINNGTVTLGSNTAAGIGGIAIASNATLAAGVSGLVIANGIQTLGNGIVDQGTGIFTLNGDIAGPGSISAINSGNLVLNGDNSFVNLGINNGTVTIGSDTGAGVGDIAIANDATLAAGGPDITLANNIQTLGNGIVNQGSGVFTLNGDITGAGSISAVGPGNLVLNGNNSFTNLGINQGTVTVGTDTAAGVGDIALFSNTTLAAGGPNITLANNIQTLGNGIVDQGSGVFTLNGQITGDGSISAVGPGILVLNGDNSFVNLGINQGTVVVGTNTAAGIGEIAINNNATLSIRMPTPGDMGEGEGDMDAEATLFAVEATSEAEPITITLDNGITTTGNGLVDAGNLGDTFILNGNIDGAGSISQIGTGNLVLNGDNSFTNLGINAGTVTVGTDTAAGIGAIAINADATLAAGVTGLTIANRIDVTAPGFVNSGTGVFTLTGVIDGDGGLTKLGTGQLNLTGISTVRGATIVNQGTLHLTGSIANSATTVQTGATLIGTGTTGALTVQAGGTVSPGSTAGSVATLNVNGAASLAGTYNVNITPGGGNDRITATGPLSLGGSLVVSQTGTYNTFYQGFTVASGSARSGTFASTSLGNFGVPFVPIVEYTGTSAIVRLTPASIVGLAGPGLSGNALAVANAFDAGVQAGYNPQPFFNLYLQGANMQNTLSEMSGEVHAAGTRVLLEDTRVIRETAFNRLNWGMTGPGGSNSTVDKGDNAFTFWITGVGSWGSANADGIGSDFSTSQTGILSGLDWVSGEFKVGAMFTWTNTDVNFDSALGQSNVSSTGGALYAGWRQAEQGFVVNAGGSVAGTNFDGSRSITAPGLAQTLTSDYGGTSWQLFGEVAYDIAASDTVRIEPFARYAYANTGNGGWFEVGGVASLEAADSDSNLSIVNVGGRAATSMQGFDLMGSVSWQGTYGDRDGFTSMGIIGVNSPAGIRAVALDENAIALEFQARYAITSTVTFGLGYSGLYGSNNSDSGVRGTLTVGF